jgi:hypothetical protein
MPRSPAKSLTSTAASPPQAGDVRDPRAFPDLTVPVVSGGPRFGGDVQDCLPDVLGDAKPTE